MQGDYADDLQTIALRLNPGVKAVALNVWSPRVHFIPYWYYFSNSEPMWQGIMVSPVTGTSIKNLRDYHGHGIHWVELEDSLADAQRGTYYSNQLLLLGCPPSTESPGRVNSKVSKVVQRNTCECGAHAVRDAFHSSWCPMYKAHGYG